MFKFLSVAILSSLLEISNEQANEMINKVIAKSNNNGMTLLDSEVTNNPIVSKHFDLSSFTNEEETIDSLLVKIFGEDQTVV